MNLKIAIQKSGRLFDDSIKLLNECGIELSNGANKLRSEAFNFPLEVFFLRDDDIPQYVEDGVADIGIVGENVIYEVNKKVKVVDKMGFGKCRLSIAIPKNDNYKTVKRLNGKKIATSYPNILGAYLKSQKVKANIEMVSGSVEIAPSVGLADAICDLVSSGSTLFANGLKEAEVIFRSEAALIANPKLNKEKSLILKKLLMRIQSVKKSRHNKYVLLNAPNNKLDVICKILPGMKSPTILPLADKGWSSVHSVIDEEKFWEVIEKLKENGAQGILVVPIEKMIV
ncbi:MAG TPA: ATP phosphoribosyltransferase [Bacteroidia bacterium]|nr:ATP phosphoribosyltransferase [Bacteroidia bacterium]